MHLLLTDRLTCPRCGPEFGLILLANRLEDRVVHEGVLGCANCRDSFPISGGLADLRAPPRGEIGPGLAGTPNAGDVAGDSGDALLAQLGILGGPGTLALVGQPARAAARLAEALPEIHVVAIDADMARWPESERVSRIVAAPGMPFMTWAMRAAAVDGRLGSAWIAEGVRVVAPRGRIVVTHAGEDVASAVEAAGARVLATDAQTIVAARS